MVLFFRSPAPVIVPASSWRIRRPVGLLGILTAEIISFGEVHGFGPLRRIGQGGNGQVIFPGRDASQHGGKIHGLQAQLHSQLVGDIVGQLDVRARIPVLAGFCGVDKFVGGKGRGSVATSIYPLSKIASRREEWTLSPPVWETV